MIHQSGGGRVLMISAAVIFLGLGFSALLTAADRQAQTNQAAPLPKTPAQAAAQTAPAQAAPNQAAAPSTQIVIKARTQDREGDRVIATGSVEVRYKDMVLQADRMEIDTKTKDVLAVGHVSVHFPDEDISAETLAFNLDTSLGKGTAVLGFVQPMVRYEAESVERKEGELYSLGRNSFTSCAQPVPRWQFASSRANFKKNDSIEMWNAVFSIKKIPIFWLPYMKYPLDRERATGFLTPSLGYSGVKGFNFSQGFYWAMARNMDATFNLDYYSAKGVGGGLEYRYLFGAGTGGQLNVFYFTYKSPVDGSVKPDDAYMFRWSHNQPLPGNSSFVADVDYQTSFNFMREFDNNFTRALVFNRRSQIYFQKGWRQANLSLRLSRFETSFPGFGQSIIRDSLPQVSFSTFKMKLFKPLYFSLSSTYHRWRYGWDSQFKEGTQTKSSEFNLSPVLSAPLNAVPWLNVNFSLVGSLSFYGNGYLPGTREVADDPFFSGNFAVNTDLVGPVLFRVFEVGKAKTRVKHIIEPSVTYRYDSPTIDADRIITPQGRFFRYHQIVYGLTNHVLVKDGLMPREIFTWGLAQAYYVSPEQSPLSLFRLDDGRVPQFSDISSYIRFYPAAGASLDFSAGYNAYKGILSSVRAAANFGTPADDRYLSISWFKSQNPWYENPYLDRHQVSVFGGAKIPALDIEAQGEVDYNIAERKLLYVAVAAIYHYQCLDFKVNLRVFYFREKPETQFRVSFGLGNIGKTTDFFGGRDL